MNNNNIISQQIERGINILRSLNDLEEIEVDKYGLPHIKFCEGQKSYDEKKLGELETKVQNWMTESETCLSTLGITLDNDNPFQMQSLISRAIDKRKALVDEIQTGIKYLRTLLNITNKWVQSQEDTINHQNLDYDDKIEEKIVPQSSDNIIKQAIKIMKEEKVIKYLYDYAFIMMIMNETEELPSFNSPKSFVEYLQKLKIDGIPSNDSIKKKENATYGKHPSWIFTDRKGRDINEAKRRIAVASRFLSFYRKGK